MRGSQQACLLCRHALRPPYLRYVRRAASSRTKPQDTFNASKLVLDLDAADNKYVRRFEDVQAEAARKKKISSRKGHDVKDYTMDKSTNHQSKARRRPQMHVYTPTHADLLGLALLGNPFSNPGEADRGVSQEVVVGLRNVLSANRLSTSYLHSQHSNDFRRLLDALKDKSDNVGSYIHPGWMLKLSNQGLARVDLLSCSDLRDLSRLSALIGRTVEGCQFLASNGHVVVDAIKTCRRANIKRKRGHGIKARDVLRYLNDLIANIESKHIEIGTVLCDAAMYYAAQSQIFSAVDYYVKLAVAKGYPGGVQRAKALYFLTHWLNDAGFAMILSRRRMTSLRAVDALKILTGREAAGVPGNGEARNSSFANLIKDSQDMYVRYIFSLGGLKASEDLWHEWNHPALTLIDNPLSETRRADIFITAFLVAQDTSRALQVLDSIPDKTSLAAPAIPPLHGRQEEAQQRNLQRLRDIRRVLVDHFEKYGPAGVEIVELQARVRRAALKIPWILIPLKPEALIKDGIEGTSADEGHNIDAEKSAIGGS